MKIEVFGPGCYRCQTTLRTVEHALNELNMEAEVVHIDDLREFAKRGVMFTPAVFIDGSMKASGRVPKLAEVKLWLLEPQRTSVEPSEGWRARFPVTS